MHNYYELLELTQSASVEEIKRAYRKCTQQIFANKGIFLLKPLPPGYTLDDLAIAYDTLIDPIKRRLYNEALQGPIKNTEVVRARVNKYYVPSLVNLCLFAVRKNFNPLQIQSKLPKEIYDNLIHAHVYDNNHFLNNTIKEESDYWEQEFHKFFLSK